MKSLKLIRSAFLLSATVLVSSVAIAKDGPQTPQDPPKKESDPRVKIALDKLKYKYILTKSANYELTFDLKEKRKQVVFVNSGTEEFGKLEIRDVTSTAYKVTGKLPTEQALRLLADNDRRKWGAWRTVEDSGVTYVIYAVQLPADSPAESLDNAINAVMYTADAMEKEMSTEDTF
jgi:hypothetical protein